MKQPTDPGRPGPVTPGVRSMTGFGHGAAEGDAVRIEVELKGVNHRFLDLKIKLPPELAAQEGELRERLKGLLIRGRVDIAVALKSTRPPAYRVEINGDLLREYVRAARAVGKELRLGGGIDLKTALSLPGAVQIHAAAPESGEAATLLQQAVDGALKAYESMRTREGERLEKDLRHRLAQIDASVRNIENQARGLPAAFAARLRERVAALVRERGLDEVRLAQEVAILAGRVDITEELVRLRGYLEQGRTILNGPGPVGKSLDFVMQEMNREANTISSKAEALSICQSALAIKAAVEMIREQVQNLE